VDLADLTTTILLVDLIRLVVSRNNCESHIISLQPVIGKINGNVDEIEVMTIKFEQEEEALVNQWTNHINMLEEFFPGKSDL
jgi:hypothetical protein